MSPHSAPSAGARRSALRRLARRLGGRIALVGDVPAPPGTEPLVRCRVDRSGDVVARPEALPVPSGALTGVVCDGRDGGAAPRALAECARTVQPGGAVVVFVERDEESAARASAAEAGLALERAAPVGSPLARLLGSRRHGVALLLGREGGDRVEIPGLGSMLRHMVVPGGRRSRPRSGRA